MDLEQHSRNQRDTIFSLLNHDPAAIVGRNLMKSTNAAAKLCKRVDIAEYKGTFVTLGDISNDGEVEFLLSYLGPYSARLRLVALDLNGAKL